MTFARNKIIKALSIFDLIGYRYENPELIELKDVKKSFINTLYLTEDIDDSKELLMMYYYIIYNFSSIKRLLIKHKNIEFKRVKFNVKFVPENEKGGTFFSTNMLNGDNKNKIYTFNYALEEPLLASFKNKCLEIFDEESDYVAILDKKEYTAYLYNTKNENIVNVALSTSFNVLFENNKTKYEIADFDDYSFAVFLKDNMYKPNGDLNAEACVAYIDLHVFDENMYFSRLDVLEEFDDIEFFIMLQLLQIYFHKIYQKDERKGQRRNGFFKFLRVIFWMNFFRNVSRRD